MRIFLVVLLLASHGVVRGEKPKAPHVTPMFSGADGVPAFYVECANTSRRPMPYEKFSPMKFRLDGVVHDPAASGFGGSLLGGPPAPVRPGESWREIVALIPSGATHNRSATLGASLRTAIPVRLELGRHRIAFECAGVWSEEVSFFWDDSVVGAKP